MLTLRFSVAINGGKPMVLGPLGFPGGSGGKNLQETQVQFLAREVALEKEMVSHSSILAWEIPWTGSLAGYSSWCHKVRHDLAHKQ